jgi:hypothetical protein
VQTAENTKQGGSNHVGLSHRGSMKATKEESKVVKEPKPKKEITG